MIELAKYEIFEEIGRGGVAVVYRGRHKVLQNDVAVKVLHSEFARDQEFVKRFINGARNAARLKHPNIIPVFDVGDEQGWYFIVMELLRGETLEERITKHGPFSLEEIEAVIAPLARALDYAHENGIIHRDIKSPNIFLKEDGSPVLTDFDIAKATDLKQNLTLDGSVLGTPAYMSPEQARGESATAKSDIYSLGVVMYEMATGELPFKGENTLSVLRQIAMDNPRPPCEINEAVSKELQTIILRCMDKSPENRPAIASGIFADAARERGAPRPAAVEPKPAAAERREKEPPRTRGKLKSLLAKVAIAVVALGAVYAGGLHVWHVLELRDFDVVSLFVPGGDFTGRLPVSSVAPAKLDAIAVERVKKLYGEAAALIKAGNTDGALEKLETIMDIDPGNRLAHRGLQKVYNWHVRSADALFKKGDYRGYRRFMDQAVSYFPDMKLDNLYERGKKFAGAGRLLGDGEDNAAAVYATIVRTFPAEGRAAKRLHEVVDRAMRKSFEENKSREYTDHAIAVAVSLPDKASDIYGICGDVYYANNVLLSRNGYNAAAMYSKALEADGSNDHARKQLLAIIAEIKNRLAGITDAHERLALVRSAALNFPRSGEFPSLIQELATELK
jgi:tRNA A-37 threonylcarbamoyl transferase component Bud32/tetratricopeptide (TPR) repeat protein